MYNIEEVKASALDYFKGDELAANVWVNKYALKDSNGNYYERTPDDMHMRLAKEFARIEAKYPNPMSEEDIFKLLEGFKFIVPQGSPMSGIGNDFQVVSISNCFVVGNEYDSYGGIMHTDQEQVQLMKRRGGVGHDLSHIRPSGSTVLNSAITSSGVASFMERFSNSTREVGQDGRRGALMLSISIKHPDSESFIDAKLEQGKVTGANISVKIDDEFMQAVMDNDDYIQTFPIDFKDIESKEQKNYEYDVLYNLGNGVYIRKIKAKRLWDKITKNSWKSAEPGILFWDTILNESPARGYGEEWKETSTNPCFPSSEYILTKDGYISFGDGFKYAKPLEILADNRISYDDDGGEETPEKWKIDNSKNGVTIRRSSPVMLTQPMADIIEIRTKNGFALKLTPDHLVATRNGMVEAKDLTIEDEILIAIPDQGESIVGKLPETEEELSAMLIGLISGDGTFDKNRTRCHIDFWGDDKERMKDIVVKAIDKLFEINGEILNLRNRKLSKYFISYKEESDKIRISSAWLAHYLKDRYNFKRETKFNVPKFIYNKSRTTIGKFYLASLFYCDASVQGTQKSGFSIRLAQSNKPFLVEVQRIAHSNGILFGIYKRRDAKKRNLPNGKGGSKEYFTKTQYELITIAGSFVYYRDFIGFIGDSVKEEKMQVNHNFDIKDKHYDNITEVIEHEPEPVYCVKEDIGRNIITNCISTKRCGEIPLNPYDSCRLLAINLFSYVDKPFTKHAKFNNTLFRSHVEAAQRLSDDIVDLEIEKIDKILSKINNDPEPEHIKRIEIELWNKIKNNAINGRRTGTGITGVGDMLAALGLTYGSDEATEKMIEVQKLLALSAYKSSVIMAKERGAFPIYNGPKDLYSNFINRISATDDKLAEEMFKHGRRNIAMLTIAPTGSTSLLTQTTSGIEPCFAPYYKRRRKINPNEVDAKIDFTDDLGDSWTEYTVFHHNFLTWAKTNGYVDDEKVSYDDEKLEELVSKSPYFKATANDVDWVAKVKMQGAMQKWVDHSISVTVNLPSSVAESTVGEINLAAYESGCKGITVYRDGSRSGVLITNKKTDKRPKELPCDIHHVQAGGERYYVLVGLLDDKPYEIFAFKKKHIQIPQIRKDGLLVKVKSGSYNLKYNGTVLENITQHFEYPDEDGFTRLLSLLLRRGISIEDIVDQVNKSDSFIGGFYKAITRVLSKNYMEAHDLEGETCPDCGGTLRMEEGCVKCTCGHSKCG